MPVETGRSVLVRVFMELRYLVWKSAKSIQMSRSERIALWNLDIYLVVSSNSPS